MDDVSPCSVAVMLVLNIWPEQLLSALRTPAAGAYPPPPLLTST